MGVTGLWKLIESSGKPVPLETLENKVLAIDISIWLHQVVKGFQDNKGNTLAHAHLLGLFNRLCKLLYYKIKPVFVFDGGVPQLKRETIAKRSQSKNRILTEAERIQAILLQTLAKEKVVQQALGLNAEQIFKSPSKLKSLAPRKPDKDDIFKLPDLPSIDQKSSEFDDNDVPTTSYAATTDISTDSDSSLDNKNIRHAYSHNLQSIDVTSNQFKSLPADIRHEILVDIKETRKKSSWNRLHELPTQSTEFSTFQMKRLLKRRQVQVCLEEAEKQMEGKSLTLNELRAFLSEEGVINAASTAASTSKQIASDENTRFLLVRDLKKAIESAAIKEEEELQNSQSSQNDKKSKTSTANLKMNEDEDDDEGLGDEYDEDMQKAIQMSLECMNNDDPVYDDKDYKCDKVKMNREQKELLKNATASLARAYLIEYGGMNEDEIKELLEETQQSRNEDNHNDDLLSSFKYNDKFIVKGEMCTPYKKMKIPFGRMSQISTLDVSEKNFQENENEIKKIRLDDDDDDGQPEEKSENIEMVSDSDDSDLVEVAEKEDPSPIKLNNSSTEMVKKQSTNNKLQITVDLTQKFDEKNDIFADVFEDLNAKIGTKENLEILKEGESSKIQKNLQIRDNGDGDIYEKQTEKFDQINTKNDEIIHVDDDDKEIKNSKIKMSNVQIESSPKDILSKLKADLENVSKITLDDIQVTKSSDYADDDIEMKVDEPETAAAESIQNSVSQAHNILDSLKKQISEVQKVTLDDIKIVTEPIKLNTETEKCSEIIEIPDDDDDIDDVNVTPSKQKIKKETISAFFETEYKIKRTPDKVKENEDDPQTTPKIKKPFFVRKTPGSSGRKRQQNDYNDVSDNEDTPSKRGKKVSKTLFSDDDDKNKDSNKTTKNEEDDVKPIENPLEVAAQLLRENKTEEELQLIANDIVKQKHDLELERNRQDRMGTTITEKMSYECMELLRLFGIPYIVAPMEAEAQCAFLNSINLTDGTITDDSDIWLFGGKTVYKNFFNQQKNVLEFRVENIEKLFNIDRKKLIQLAILVGSDYTAGISGIGAVTALEILAAFPPTPQKDGETSENVSVISSLRKFREWWRNGKLIGSSGRTALRSKLRNIELTEGFPNLNVVEAYLNPKVDVSRENFSWGVPDVETIYEFTRKTFGWTKLKTDEILQPVMKKLNEKKIQSSIRNYFAVKSVSSLSVRDLKVSKRVQKAIDKLSRDYQLSETDDEQVPKSKKPRVRKQQRTAARSNKTVKNANEKESNSTEIGGGDSCDAELNKKKRMDGSRNKRNTKQSNNEQEDVINEPVPSTSTAATTATVTNSNKSKPNLSKLLLQPSSDVVSEFIPQREKDAREMRKRKEKAVEILKKIKIQKK